MTKEESIETKIKKDSFKKGLILGVIVLALNIFSFYFITTMVDNPRVILIVPFFFTMIVPFVISVFFAFDTRKRVGGYLSFRQSVTLAFIMFFTNYVLLTVGRDVLFVKLVEPNMIQKTEATMLRSSVKMYKLAGLNQNQIKTSVDGLKKGFDEQNNMSIFAIIGGYISTILLLFVLSLALAAILKKDVPAQVAAQNTASP